MVSVFVFLSVFIRVYLWLKYNYFPFSACPAADPEPRRGEQSRGAVKPPMSPFISLELEVLLHGLLPHALDYSGIEGIFTCGREVFSLGSNVFIPRGIQLLDLLLNLGARGSLSLDVGRSFLDAHLLHFFGQVLLVQVFQLDLALPHGVNEVQPGLR